MSGSESPLALYTARMLAKKAMEQYEVAGDSINASFLAIEYAHSNKACNRANLTALQRRRLSNDSHALVVDGLDRHGLWRNSRNAVPAGREASAS